MDVLKLQEVKLMLVVVVLLLLLLRRWTFRSAGAFRQAVPSQVAPGAVPLVPKLIHQTWKDDQLPDKWKEAQKSCIDLHPDYEYKLWTDKDAELVGVQSPVRPVCPVCREDAECGESMPAPLASLRRSKR